MWILSLPLLISVPVLALFGDSQAFFLLAALAGSGSAVYGLMLLLRRPDLVRFSNFMAVSLLLGYALGTVIFAAGQVVSAADLDLTETTSLGYRVSDLSVALLLVYIVCSALFFLSRWETPIFGPEQLFNSSTFPRARLLIWIGAGMVLVAFEVGGLGYMGAQATESANVSVIGSLSELLVPILLPMSVLCIVEETSLWRRLWLLFAAGLFVLSLVVIGRRTLIYSILLILIALVVSGKKLPNYSLSRWVAIGLSAIGLLILTSIGFYYFYALRLTIANFGVETGLGNLLSETSLFLQYELGDVSTELLANATERPFILSYLAAFVGVQSLYSPLWGDELVYALKTAIPTIVFPNKTLILPSSVEEFVHPAFGFYVFDGPNTIITAGLDDFGFIGAVLYPILLVGVYIVIRHFLYRLLPTFIYYFVMFRLIYMLLYVEQSLAGMLTSSLRDLALITALYYLVWNLPTFRESSSISRVR